MQAIDLINRIKNMKEFVVELELEPGDYEFKGVVPFDLTIKENKVTAKVLAASQAEAATIVMDYFDL